MTERNFDTGYWSDPFVQGLTMEAKLLFVYIWTNRHCNQAGLYEISLRSISFETGIALKTLPSVLKSLSPKVEWYPDRDLIWIKSFLRRQSKSPKFTIAAIKTLESPRIPEDIRDKFETYNEELLRGLAPSEHVSPTKRECVIIRDNFQCQYCGKEITAADDYEMDHIIPLSQGGKENYQNLVTACRRCNQKKLDRTPAEAGMKKPEAKPFHGAQATYYLRTNISIRERWLSLFPDRYKVVSMLINIDQHYANFASKANAVPNANANAKSKAEEKGVVKGEEEPRQPEKAAPRSESEMEESLCGGDQAIISAWSSVRGFDLDGEAAQSLVARLRTAFPEIDILGESNKWAVRKLSDPLTPNSRPANQLWNWMVKAKEYSQEETIDKSSKRSKGSRPASDFRGRKW